MEVRVKQPPTATARPNGRKGSRKVRTGCLTCKVRKVKCDETKPQCLRCTRTGHHCRGYASAPLPDSAAAYVPDTSQGTHHHHHHYHRFKTPPQQSSALSSSSGPHPTPSPSPGSWPHATLAQSEDPHAFDFFRKYSAALFSFSSDASFWSDLVLRVSAHDPAIHNAASAIGNFHIDFLSASNPGHPGAAEPFSTRLSPIRLRAITQYNKAINNVVPVLSGTKACEPVVLTMISILFACIEYLQGNERQGLKHIIQARRLLAHFGRTSQLSSSDISLLKRHAVPLITRSSWRAQFFGLKASPIPDELQDYLVIPSSFASVQDARDCFFAIFDQTLYSIRPKEAPFFESEFGRLEGPEADKRAYAGRRISDWWSAFVLSKAIGPAEFRESAQAISVQLWYKTSQLIHELWGASRDSSDEAAASGRPSYSESLFDCRSEDFSEIYSLSSHFFALRSKASPGAPSSPPDMALPGVPTRPMSGNKVFEFESHILSNVLWGAGKCRHPRLRRQFALLLAQNDHVYENAIYAKEAAIVAARIIKLEEDAAMEYARRYGTFTEDSTHWGLGENPDPAGTQPDPEARQLQLDRDFAAVCSLGYWPLPLNGTRDMAPEPEPDSPPALPRTELSPTLAYRPSPGSSNSPGGDLQTPENSPPSEASPRGSENGSNPDEPSVYATLRNIPNFPLKPPFGIPYSARICETHLISRHPNGIWIQHTKRPWGSNGKAEYIQEWVEL